MENFSIIFGVRRGIEFTEDRRLDSAVATRANSARLGAGASPLTRRESLCVRLDILNPKEKGAATV